MWCAGGPVIERTLATRAAWVWFPVKSANLPRGKYSFLQIIAVKPLEPCCCLFVGWATQHQKI